jgi:DNA helicase IV
MAISEISDKLKNSVDGLHKVAQAKEFTDAIKANTSPEFMRAIDEYMQKHPEAKDEMLRVILARISQYYQSDFSTYFYSKLKETNIIGTSKELGTLTVLLDRLLYGTLIQVK